MSLAFPDINVWLALSIEHSRQQLALDWWRQPAGGIAFCRFTQLGLLRLLTTAGVMDGKPLTMRQAWKTYDRFRNDERVEFIADAYLLAFATELGGIVVTF